MTFPVVELQRMFVRGPLWGQPHHDSIDKEKISEREAAVYVSNQESPRWRRKWIAIGTVTMLTIGGAAGTANAAALLPVVKVTQVGDSTLVLTASNVDPYSTVSIKAVMDGNVDEVVKSAAGIAAIDPPMDEDMAETTDTTLADTATTIASATPVMADDADDDDESTTPTTKASKSEKSRSSKCKCSKHHHKRHVRNDSTVKVRADDKGRVKVVITIPANFAGDISAVLGSTKKGSKHTSRCSKHVKEDTEKKPSSDSASDDEEVTTSTIVEDETSTTLVPDDETTSTTTVDTVPENEGLSLIHI